MDRLIRAAQELAIEEDVTAGLSIDATAPGIEDSFDDAAEFGSYLDLSDPRQLRRILINVSSESDGTDVVLDFNASKPAVHLTVRGSRLEDVDRIRTLMDAKIEQGRRFAFPEWWPAPFFIAWFFGSLGFLIATDAGDESGNPAWAWWLLLAYTIVMGSLFFAPVVWKMIAPPLEITTPSGEPRVERVGGSAWRFARWLVGGTIFILIGFFVDRAT